jgi:glucose/arabinose dehydrogenase/lysophospholipase L1-like esterase
MLRLPLGLLLVAASLATAAAQTSLTFNPPAGVTPKHKHVVLLSGDEEYRSEEAMPMLAKILSQRHGFACTVLFALDPDGTINPDNGGSLPGSEALDTADAIVMSLRFRHWPDDAMKRFEAAYLRGVPLIALRTSTHAFNFPADSAWAKYTYNAKSGPWVGGFGKNVLGETWVAHWGRHKSEAQRAVVETGAASDPILRDVGDIFVAADVYEAYPPADAKILLRGLVLQGMNPKDAPADTRKRRSTDKQEQPVNDPAMAIAWTRQHRNEAGKTNRVLTATLGAATDLENESLRRLVVNGVYWGLGLEVPAKADVRLVDPYQPRMFGFQGYRTGLKPANYALGKIVPEGGPPPAPPQKAKAAPAPAPKQAQATPAAPPAFRVNAGEKIAFVGNALADRMQHHGWLETMMHEKFPAQRLVVRNLAVAGDEVVNRARSKDFGTPEEWLANVQADVVFAFFGFNESFQGPDGVAKFTQELDTYLKATRAKHFNGTSAPRIVLFSPIAVEKHPDPNLPDPTERNKNLALYTAAMAQVARDQAGVTFVDLFAPSQQLYDEAARAKQPPLTLDGVHLTEAGEAKVAQKMFPLLFGEAAPPLDTPAALQIRAAVNAKNAWWHSRYRTVDGYNVYGDRSKIAYVSAPDQPKITNTQVMMEEMAQRDTITTNLERKLWAVANGEKAPVEELPLPPVTPFGTNKPGPRPDGSYDFLGGEEAIAKMTLAPGLKVNLFASEERFPQLAKAVQMAWDTKGRLWVAVWPSYPERTPTSQTGDSIIILEDTDRDGKADKCTTFVTDLNCPTGFQFFKDGILLMQAPDLWFVRDTNGDDKADTKERVLMGLDSADTHHTANSLIYEPGGAILLSDGVFHRTQVETVAGAVRNIDGALYRYEPLTQRFETYVSYAFANPHGRAFDYWGNDIITDATGNNTYFGPAFSGKIDFPAKHPRLKQIWERPSRPSAGSTILTSAHFPEEYWGDYLNPNVIGFQGIYRVKLVPDGAGQKGVRQTDIISSIDRNFRPIDTNVGPDGALYVIDWHNPLIGHLQSHLRDANRDHTHGRIYRITAEGRPLAWQPKIDGEPIPVLLELLKRRENQIRNLAKIELGKRNSADVIAALDAWVAKLDASAPDYAHHLTEALWVHQWHNRVDLALLDRVIHSPEPRARAAAARVVSYWRERVPNALALLRERAADADENVRLHAVRAASFFPVAEAAEVPLAALKLPVDYYLDYVIGETLRQLRPQWRKSISEGGQFAGGDPASVRYLLRTLTVADVLKLPRTDDVAENILGRQGVPDAVRVEALASLAQSRHVAPVALLVQTIQSPGEIDVTGVGKLLLAQKPADLKAHRAELLKLALNDSSDPIPQAWAAIALADGSLEAAWRETSASPIGLATLLAGIPMIPDATLRATAYDRVMALLAKESNELPGPDYVVGWIQRDAIRSAVSTRREPAAVFAALTSMITRGYQVPTAAIYLRRLPKETWPAAAAATAAQALVAWAAKTHPSERADREFAETMQVADELASTLPGEEATVLRKQIVGLRPLIFVVRTVVEGMRYDTPRIVVPLGRSFDIVFDNPDVMPHNLVVVKPGTREKVGTAAAALSPEYLDRSGRAWVPESIDILAGTKLIETGRSETLRMRPIREEGVYEYICTFPGHFVMMYGQLVVTEDVQAYLKANPEPAKVATAEQPVHHH